MSIIRALYVRMIFMPRRLVVAVDSRGVGGGLVGGIVRNRERVCWQRAGPGGGGCHVFSIP